jgi:hypothetical protein
MLPLVCALHYDNFSKYAKIFHPYVLLESHNIFTAKHSGLLLLAIGILVSILVVFWRYRCHRGKKLEGDRDMGLDSPHEHPVHFSREPFLHPRAHAVLRAAVMPIENDRHTIGVENALRDLEDRCSTIEWLAELSRQMVHGRGDARQLFRRWLQACSCDHHVDEGVQGVKDNGVAADHDVVQHGVAHKDATSMLRSGQHVFNLAPLIDVFIGIAYEAQANAKTMALHLAHMRAYISEFAPSIELLYVAATKPLSDGLRHETLRIALRTHGERVNAVEYRANEGHDHSSATNLTMQGMPAHADLLTTLDHLIEAWKTNNPIFEWYLRTNEEAQNASLAGLSSLTATVGDTLELLASKDKPFARDPPANIGVFFCPGVPATIKHWSKTSVSISVPDGAQSGPVFFGNVLSGEDIKVIDAATQETATLVGSAWETTFLSRYPTTTFARPPQDHINPATIVHILTTTVDEFVMLDGTGTRLQILPRKPDTIVRLAWRVASSDAADVSVRILIDGVEVLKSLSKEGYFPIAVSQIVAYRAESTNEQEGTRITLEVNDGHHTVTNDLITAGGHALLRMLAFLADYISVRIGPRNRRTGTRHPARSFLFFRLSHVAPRDLTVTFSSSDPRVEVEHSVVVLQGERGWFIRIIAREIGHAGEPAAVITASALGYGDASVEIWVEPSDGVWRWRLGGLESNPRTLPLIAIHAALLRTGQVLFFSGDEVDHTRIDLGKCVLWDPVTEQVVHSAHMDRNLFCAGHCFLPDGRLMVAGGHAPPPVPDVRNADHDVHIFDPSASLENSWSRLRDMRDGRWYPTCLTLPSGRALIVSGSSGGAPPWGTFTINEDYDVVDPASGVLTIGDRRFLSHPDMYPFLHVLPGGTVFFHSRDISRLFFNDTTVTGPLGRRVSEHRYPTLSVTTRTYPGQAACVVLPLIPDSDNCVTRARLLVIGGGGSLHPARRGEAHLPHEHEFAVNTCEIFEFDATLEPNAVQRGWRETGRLTHRRFMSDGVLLPDGTVLTVGGMGRGKADDNEDPVVQAELFDPETESWRPMAEMTIVRRYHSNALLLPDGRVITCGGTAGWPPHPDTNEFRLEFFYPPYLYRGPRPEIERVSPRPRYNEIFTIVTSNAHRVHSVSVVRASSTTHTLNTDQRYVQLRIEGREIGELRVRAPYDSTIAPPGWYMLFLLTEDKIPSRGQFVQLIHSE